MTVAEERAAGAERLIGVLRKKNRPAGDVRYVSIMIGVDTKSHPLNIMKTAYSYVRFSTPEQEIGDSEPPTNCSGRLLLRKEWAPALRNCLCRQRGLCVSRQAQRERGAG